MNMLSGLRPPGSQLLRDAYRLRGEQLAATSSERCLRAWRLSEACRLPRDIPTRLVRGTYRTYIYFRTTYRIVRNIQQNIWYRIFSTRSYCWYSA
jgi:hypothetical protein